MSNKQADGKKVFHDISPRMRAAAFEGLAKYARSQGMTLSEVWAMWWAEDWQACIDKMAKFLPTESKVNKTVKHEGKVTHIHEAKENTDAWLAEQLKECSDSTSIQ